MAWRELCISACTLYPLKASEIHNIVLFSWPEAAVLLLRLATSKMHQEPPRSPLTTSIPQLRAQLFFSHAVLQKTGHASIPHLTRGNQQERGHRCHYDLWSN